MAFTAADVMLRAQYILQDASAVRWTPPELRLWLNDALREIAIRAPNATSASVEITLQQGTYQTLAAEYQSLLRITRNLTTLDASASKRGGGRVVTPIAREIMDAQLPGWQDNAVLPYARTVIHYIEEILDPRSFYVVPGNDGNGVVEAIVSRVPQEVPVPAAPASPLDVASYTTTVQLADVYRNAVVDYMLYRAFSKDMQLAGAFERARAHYGQFADALGIKLQMDQAGRMAARSE